MNDWLPQEEIYLHSILKSCEQLSNIYLEKHRVWKRIQTRIKIPVIIIGSFTGITSFGAETFPKSFQKWISISVGVITVSIAILNTIESYFSIGDIANSSLNVSIAFQQLREDINKELSIPNEDRQATGVIFIRDIFTRYQQILSQAPVLDDGNMKYIDEVTTQKMRVMKKRTDKEFIHEELEIEKEYQEKINPKLVKSQTLLRHLGLSRFSSIPEESSPSSKTNSNLQNEVSPYNIINNNIFQRKSINTNSKNNPMIDNSNTNIVINSKDDNNNINNENENVSFDLEANIPNEKENYS